MIGNYKLLLEGILIVLTMVAVYGSSFMFNDSDADAQMSGSDDE